MHLLKAFLNPILKGSDRLYRAASRIWSPIVWYYILLNPFVSGCWIVSCLIFTWSCLFIYFYLCLLFLNIHLFGFHFHYFYLSSFNILSISFYVFVYLYSLFLLTSLLSLHMLNSSLPYFRLPTLFFPSWGQTGEAGINMSERSPGTHNNLSVLSLPSFRKFRLGKFAVEMGEGWGGWKGRKS